MIANAYGKHKFSAPTEVLSIRISRVLHRLMLRRIEHGAPAGWGICGIILAFEDGMPPIRQGQMRIDRAESLIMGRHHGPNRRILDIHPHLLDADDLRCGPGTRRGEGNFGDHRLMAPRVHAIERQ
jgi:hypothetical protein